MSGGIASLLLPARRVAGALSVRRSSVLRSFCTGLVGVAAVAALIMVPAAPASAHESVHNVYLNGTMYIVDDDEWGDDVAHVPFRGFAQVGPPYASSNFYATSGCADEVRVDLYVAIHDGPASLHGWVLANVTARLYEGASCNNNDLDGVTTLSFWIQPNTTVTRTFRVRNNDEAGDYSDLRLDVHNAT
jgi:hypothetical protein